MIRYLSRLALATAALITTTLSVSALCDRRDRDRHLRLRQVWEVLDEELDDELSDVELAMLEVGRG